MSARTLLLVLGFGATACAEILGLDAYGTEGSATASKGAGGTTVAQSAATGGADSSSGGMNGSGASTASSSTGTGGAPALKRVFVTSAVYSASMVYNPSLADAHCQLAADAAPATMGGTWRAWISQTGTNAIDNIMGDGPWHRLADDQLVFDSKADITDFEVDGPYNGILFDEAETNRSGEQVWTGTSADGSLASNCEDWNPTSTAGATYGLAGDTSVTWTIAGQAPCANQALRLYCFEE